MTSAALQSLARGLGVAALLLAPGPYAMPARAADAGYVFSSNGGGRAVELGIGKSFVVDLPADAAEVLVADPKIANAIVRSARKAYVIGVTLGDTDIIFFDANGQQIESLAVSVSRDLTPLRRNIRTSIPGASVTAASVGDSVMLTGSVKSASEAQTAVDIAANLVGSSDKVVNALAIEGREQVLLKVSVVEMQRTIAKQFGINWEFNRDTGTSTFNASSNPADFSPIGLINGTHTFGANTITAELQALENNNMLRTLAEPNLTAISGEKAEFLAGGEFPVTVQTEDGNAVEYKKFGVSLSFTPVVLSSGRISLALTTEVSERAEAGSTSLNVRRATTVVELPSGGSLALAGLLQDNNRQAINGMPGLINLPVLGALFRSRDYQRGQTELVVIVTPYIAKSPGRDKLARPDDGFSTPSDAETILLGRLNKIYAPGLKPASGSYRGPIGHIVE